MTSRASVLILLCAFACAAAAPERVAAGLSGKGTVIDAEIFAGDQRAPRVLLIGGLSGDDASSAEVRKQVRKYDNSPKLQRRFRLLAISVANPDRARLVFPPSGDAYRENPESHALWRWTAARVPDLVLIAGPDEAGLAAALSGGGIAGFGRIPARAGLEPKSAEIAIRSEARQEQDRRLARTPRETAAELARVYGHELPEAVYIPAMALIGRLRRGEAADVERIAAPFVTGSADSLEKPTSSHLAGHLLFAELAARTRNPKYIELVRRVADLGFEPSGALRASMPFHSEMSDSVFMGCPILAAAGKLTGEAKYFEMARRHFRFVRDLCLRPDGLYRHSPLNEAAWGRGNAFPALGLALTLANMPADHPAFDELRLAFQQHAAALSRYQQPDGMWRQVIDHPGAYDEFSATAMIGIALVRGIQNGWLDPAAYQPRVARAWDAISARTAPGGELLDLCESTGKQKTLADYLHRKANFGRDARGGGMALLFAVEMAGLR